MTGPTAATIGTARNLPRFPVLPPADEDALPPSQSFAVLEVDPLPSVQGRASNVRALVRLRIGGVVWERCRLVELPPPLPVRGVPHDGRCFALEPPQQVRYDPRSGLSAYRSPVRWPGEWRPALTRLALQAWGMCRRVEQERKEAGARRSRSAALRPASGAGCSPDTTRMPGGYSVAELRALWERRTRQEGATGAGR